MDQERPWGSLLTFRGGYDELHVLVHVYPGVFDIYVYTSTVTLVLNGGAFGSCS